MIMLTSLEASSKFSIDSIKEMMDGLDPAALLPSIDIITSKAEPICRVAIMVGPILLILMGVGYLLLAPREANHYFGYKTYFGMGSVSAWRFTQRVAGVILGVLGLLLTLVMLIVSAGFGGLAPDVMVRRTVICLVWQAVLALLANIAINVIMFNLYDRKGNLRRKKKE